MCAHWKWNHVSDKGIGCSMGEGLSNFPLLLCQISFRSFGKSHIIGPIYIGWHNFYSMQHQHKLSVPPVHTTLLSIYTKLTHKYVIPSRPHHYWFSSSSISVRLWTVLFHCNGGFYPQLGTSSKNALLSFWCTLGVASFSEILKNILIRFGFFSPPSLPSWVSASTDSDDSR